jgi:hypothetical protein
MFKVKNLRHKDAPDWLRKSGATVYISDSRALDFSNKGYVKLIRHFRWLVVKNICPTCKQVVREKRKEYDSGEL